jgi:hypothetical protein
LPAAAGLPALPLPPWAWEQFAKLAQQQLKAAADRQQHGAHRPQASALQAWQQQHLHLTWALHGHGRALANVLPKPPAAHAAAHAAAAVAEASATSPLSASKVATKPVARKRPSAVNTAAAKAAASLVGGGEAWSPGTAPRSVAKLEPYSAKSSDGGGSAVVPLSPLLLSLTHLPAALPAPEL